MKRQHEQSIIDVFKEIFSSKCKQLGENFHISASLDGQDNHLGADYLFSVKTKFILIEFKYEKKNIKYGIIRNYGFRSYRNSKCKE